MFNNPQIATLELPKVQELQLVKVERSYLYILILNRLFGFLFPLVALITTGFITNFEGWLEFFWLGIAVILLLLLLSCLYSYISFPKRKYALRDHDIIYTEGLLLNTFTTVPFVRIQHTEISRSFLERKLNLSTLKIYTAGATGSDLFISGLPTETAQSINAFLTTKINDQL